MEAQGEAVGLGMLYRPVHGSRGALVRILSEKNRLFIRTSVRLSRRNHPVPGKKSLRTLAWKAETKWLIGMLLLALALGALIGAIAVGRLRFLFPR